MEPGAGEIAAGAGLQGAKPGGTVGAARGSAGEEAPGAARGSAGEETPGGAHGTAGEGAWKSSAHGCAGREPLVPAGRRR